MAKIIQLGEVYFFFPLRPLLLCFIEYFVLPGCVELPSTAGQPAWMTKAMIHVACLENPIINLKQLLGHI